MSNAKAKIALPEKDLMALGDRAQQGDAAALAALQELFQNPDVVEVTGNLARRVEEALVARYCGRDLLTREGLTRKLEALRAELAGAGPTPLERLLVDRVVACWLHLHVLEATYAAQNGMPLALGIYFQRSITAAQKRYLSAIKTLALVRNLAVPVLQVNIAKKQVNMAGPCAAPAAADG